MKPLSFLFLLSLTPLLPAQELEPEGELVDAVLVIINDSILTSSMLDAEVQRILHRQPEMEEAEANSIALSNGVRKILFEETFKKLGFEDDQIDTQVDLRIQQLILEDGSRASFEENLRRDGYASIDDFRQDLRFSFIQNTVSGILGGIIPSPNKGYRTLAEPTPEEIRAAYDAREEYRHRDSQLEWAQLQFFQQRDQPPAEERAAEVANQLGAGLLSPQQALEKADRVRRHTSIPAGMQSTYQKFLQTGNPGDSKLLPTSAGGVAQLLLILGRTEARDFSFKEAQLSIVKDLTEANRNKAVLEALADLYRQSYVWVNPQIQGLAESLEMTFGTGNVGPATDEL